MITELYFIRITGRRPIQDDLERCNCGYVGSIGHQQCGICGKCGQPRFICGCIARIADEHPEDSVQFLQKKVRDLEAQLLRNCYNTATPEA